MNVIKLIIENVKRVTAVNITPEVGESLVTIGGKNESGKTSVLDAISYALGGEKLVPAEPIRVGESEAKVFIDLGDYHVTRQFHREFLPCDCGVAEGPPHQPSCASLTKFGPTKSTLTVKNKEGAKYPSPQALLDKLYGKLTFDPLAFKNEEPKKQQETLRRLTGLDFTAMTDARRAVSERRAMTKKTLTLAEAKLSQLPRHSGAPTVEVPAQSIASEMSAARALKQKAGEQQKQHDQFVNTREALLREQTAAVNEVEQLEAKLAAARKTVLAVAQKIEVNTGNLRVSQEACETAEKAVPDFAAIEQKMVEAEAINKRVRENAAYMEQEHQVVTLTASVVSDDAEIVKLDQEKVATLQAAKFPVEGLGFSDNGITYNGCEFSEVSSSVQLRVSLAIGLALNPTLKVLLIRNGNLLDDDGLKAVAEQAAAAGAQVWMEYVTGKAGDVSVMLEEGHVQ